MWFDYSHITLLQIDEEDELDMLVADDIYVFKVNSFLSTIWKEMIHQTIDIFEKLFDLLDTLIELEMTAARYTALTFGKRKLKHNVEYNMRTI